MKCFFLFSLVSGVMSSLDFSNNEIDDRRIVVLDEDANVHVMQSLTASIKAHSASNLRPLFHATVGGEMNNLNMFLIDHPTAEAIKFLEAQENVQGVFKDGLVRAINTLTEEEVNTASEGDVDEAADGSEDWYNWGIDRINQKDANLDFKLGMGKRPGEGVNIYILDTGLNTRHIEFKKPGDREVMNVWSAYSDVANNNDLQGHGTHCASSAAGRKTGVAKFANVYGVKVLGDSGSGTYSDVIAGIDYVKGLKMANESKKMVASMSLAGGYNGAANAAVSQLTKVGVPVIVAAGNGGSSDDACTSSPASTVNAVTVGSSTSTDYWSSFSSVGPCLDIIAPGSLVRGACARGSTLGSSCSDRRSFLTLSGTSMATPHVAGVAALWMQKRNWNNAMPRKIHKYLICTAQSDVISGVPADTPNKFLQIPRKLTSVQKACLNTFTMS